jgi:hypothetical protein
MMATPNLYSTLRWQTVAARARRRDGNRCTVSRLLGGDCTGTLHVHHIVAVSEGGAEFDLENLGTACSAHHPLWESLRRVLVRRLMAPAPRCPHHHRSAEARRLCEARLARRSGALAA